MQTKTKTTNASSQIFHATTDDVNNLIEMKLGRPLTQEETLDIQDEIEEELGIILSSHILNKIIYRMLSEQTETTSNQQPKRKEENP